MYPNYPQTYLQNLQQFQPQPNQTSGFIPVPNESVARSYPVAYGASVSFKDENAPYIYTKTMGFSQLETPKFEKFRLVKEESEMPQDTALTSAVDKMPNEESKDLYEAIRGDVDKLKKEIAKLKKDIKAMEMISSTETEAADLNEVENE